MRKVYLDYNATTPIDPSIVSLVQPLFRECFGNPSSIHWAGRGVRGYYDRAKEQVAELICSEPEEVVFTSCGSESDNQAIKGVAYSRQDRGRHIITSSVEHPAVLNTCRHLETRGFDVTYLPVDSFGRIDVETVRGALRPDTILITIMYANNETGTLAPLRETGAMAKERGIIFHSDMVQALGKVPIDVGEMNVDLASFSGHKLYAPKGVGALFVKKGIEIENLIHGGHQESSRRAGTENMIGISAFGKACEIARLGMEEQGARLDFLRTKLLEGIMSGIDGVTLNGDPDNRLPNTLNLSFESAEGESLVIALDLKGIAVSSGSACSSGSTVPSHVLTAMGIPAMLCQSAIRFSLGKENTEEDVDYTLSVLPGVVSRLREISPFCKGRS